MNLNPHVIQAASATVTATAAAALLAADGSDAGGAVPALWSPGAVLLILLAAGLVVALWLILHWNLRGAAARLAAWIRDLRLGRAIGPPPLPSFLRALAGEIGRLAGSFHAAQEAARQEARLRETGEAVWTAERLREHCRTKLDRRPLVVVSNREPYVHERVGREIRCVVPASGLVTALEPILRACGGTWVAHGSGSADRVVVDARQCVGVPPEAPQYALRRVWLTPAEEAGYYYGFSNEGLWPLCHIAHTRPLFRAEDWAAYQAVNARFADAVLEEIEGAAEPCVLLQDYHFALLPRLIKERRPDARVALFWHIPWPNPEAFGICPWKREILEGMLGADLIGFHLQFHCNNFLDTVDRVLEARTERERFAVSRRNHVTNVRPYPISVAFTGPAVPAADAAAPGDLSALRARLGLTTPFVGVGVDRIDYTKGLIERFRAVERFLEKYPSYEGRFSFVELGAPSRTSIPRYLALDQEVEAEVRRINAAHPAPAGGPIRLHLRHHGHGEILPFYRAADLCFVTSLHDGMNLVAKEFIAARHDEDGVLILSQFAGAAQELRDALIVNPYDTDQMADALRYALEMEGSERQARMRRLRAVVRERNVYRWAAELIGDLAQLRVDAPAEAAAA